jgi:hypothetical protein
MTMPEHDDSQFEAYLRQFRPHHPRPLPDKRWILFRRWAYPAAAAAIVAMVFGLSIARRSHKPAGWERSLVSSDQASHSQQLSLLRLSILANQDPAKFDDQLDRSSATLLPDVQSGHGVLRTLSAAERF